MTRTTPTRFRAVIFDLGGVVLESPLPAIAAYETETGLPPHFVARLVVEGGAEGPWARLERGELDLEAFGAAFAQQAVAAGCRLDGARLLVASQRRRWCARRCWPPSAGCVPPRSVSPR